MHQLAMLGPGRQGGVSGSTGVRRTHRPAGLTGLHFIRRDSGETAPVSPALACASYPGHTELCVLTVRDHRDGFAVLGAAHGVVPLIAGSPVGGE